MLWLSNACIPIIFTWVRNTQAVYLNTATAFAVRQWNFTIEEPFGCRDYIFLSYPISRYNKFLVSSCPIPFQGLWPPFAWGVLYWLLVFVFLEYLSWSIVVEHVTYIKWLSCGLSNLNRFYLLIVIILSATPSITSGCGWLSSKELPAIQDVYTTLKCSR